MTFNDEVASFFTIKTRFCNTAPHRRFPRQCSRSRRRASSEGHSLPFWLILNFTEVSLRRVCLRQTVLLLSLHFETGTIYWKVLVFPQQTPQKFAYQAYWGFWIIGDRPQELAHKPWRLHCIIILTLLKVQSRTGFLSLSYQPHSGEAASESAEAT